MFSSISRLSYRNSKIILLLLILFVEAVGIVVSYQKNRSIPSIFTNISLPFGIYTFLAYGSADPLLFMMAFTSAAILSAFFLKPAITRLIGTRMKTGKVCAVCIKQIVTKAQLYFAIALFCAMAVIAIGPLDGSSILHSVTAARQEEATIANNMETIL